MTYVQFMSLVQSVGGFQGLRFIGNATQGDQHMVLQLDSRERVDQLVSALEEASIPGVSLIPNGGGSVVVVLSGE